MIMFESTITRLRVPRKSGTPSGEIGMLFGRCGIGAVMVFGGGIVLVLSLAGLGVGGFAMATGRGLPVLLLNGMYHLSLSSERDRLDEERARRYFDEPSVWPEEEARQPGRRWTLPPGVATPEAETAQRS
jgi:hypothetical protein